MKSKTAILLVGLLCGLGRFSSAAFAEPMAPPNGPPPIPTRAMVQNGTLFRLQATFVPETRTRLVDAGGQRREEAYTVMMPQLTIASTPKQGYRVYTVEGKPLTDAEAATTLAKETEVLLSVQGKLIDPRYQPLYVPEALVVYLKPEFALPGFTAPQPLGVPAPPPPAFSSAASPKGTPPTVGFLTNQGGEVLLTEYRWDMINESKPVHIEVKDASGNPSTVMKMVSQVHWIPEPIETRLKPTDVTAMDRSGKQTHGLLDDLSEQPLAVFVHDVNSEFDPAHFRLCQPYVAVVQGKFPMERLMTSYGAPAAPVEAFASVKGEDLIVGKMITESITVQKEITVMRNGKEGIQTVTEAKTVHKYVPQRMRLAAVKAQEASGKTLDAAELKRRLATETPVMTAIGDEPVDSMYLAPLKPDTIVLALPPMQLPALAAPPPPPAERAPQASAPRKSPSGSPLVSAQAPMATAPAAQAPPKAPAEGPPPRLVKVQAFGNKLVLREPRTMYGFPPVAEPKPGTPRKQAKPKAMTHVDSRVLDASAFRLYEVEGRPMAPAVFAESAARPITAMLSDHGKKIDPAWLSIYRPGALVVYVRPESLHGYAMPAPAAPRTAPPPPTDAAPSAPAKDT